MSDQPLLVVEGLSVDFPRDGRRVRVVEDVGFALSFGERVALVGESGSGKSVTARALVKLDERARLAGRVIFAGQDLSGLDERAMTKIRGAGIGMAFQDPMASLDPLMRVGDQIAETAVIHGASAAEAEARAASVLEEFGVRDAASRVGAWPHEFSGGMRQRVVLAMALAADPKLLIADEPTTALDVRVQRQVLAALEAVADSRGLAVLLITHDLGVVASFAERVLVMYAGRLVEDAPVQDLFDRPLHPYAAGLIAAVPRADRDVERLETIPGNLPSPEARPPGCAYHPRCPLAIDRCRAEAPPARSVRQAPRRLLARRRRRGAAPCFLNFHRSRRAMPARQGASRF